MVYNTLTDKQGLTYRTIYIFTSTIRKRAME